jgi:hypothetical protein
MQVQTQIVHNLAVFVLYHNCLAAGLNIRYLVERSWFVKSIYLQDLLRHVVVDLDMGRYVNVAHGDFRIHLELLVLQNTAEENLKLKADLKDAETVVWYDIDLDDLAAVETIVWQAPEIDLDAAETIVWQSTD